MKTNWLSAALILGAAGSDGAGALASEVPGPLAGVKKQTSRDSLSLSLSFDMFDIYEFISDAEDIFILSALITFCLTVGFPFAPFLILVDYLLDLGIIF
uniref:WGS project CBMG000000000 data, contig CS5907-c001516 n=1 Tax=Fusarium acuminatum CS5907 TaxID=1318461 RepID=A0A096PF55_9HYPO|nr:unnamed protein product [Fusarium acuminatum CS5907]